MNRKKFTLMEMVIVITIIALLAAVVGPMYMRHLKKARVSTAKSQISMLEQAVLDYQLDMGNPPMESEGLEVLIRNVNNSKKWRGKYLRATVIPLDPWGNPYVYRCPGEENDFAIISLGADGKEGGEGDNADISSENLGNDTAETGN